MRKFKKNGQFSVEYAAFIMIIVVALIAMHGYIQRAIMGTWKKYADSWGSGLQYDPGVTYIYRYIYKDSYPWSG